MEEIIKATINQQEAGMYFNGVKIANAKDWNNVMENYNRLQQENKQLKELCDKYEKEHSTTFQIWLTSIDEYRKQKSLLDKIKEYFNKDVKEELNYLYQKSDDFFKGKDYGDKGYGASIQSVQAIRDNILSIIDGE